MFTSCEQYHVHTMSVYIMLFTLLGQLFKVNSLLLEHKDLVKA